MGCAGCSVKSKDGTPQGCRSNGSCGTSGCNRLNTFDWLATQEVVDVNPFDLVEVSFKNGSRKDFYINQQHLSAVTGDMVVVEGSTGYDVGRISLSGDLVRLQMKKKRAKQDHVVHKVLRHANQRDLEKLDYARSQEIPTMIRARAIARSLDMDMKVGDVEFQGDNRKATFYYTAEGRVDFRELIRHFAKDFRVKIEMRQIGARQESAKIGGIGSCGRELCCSTWLSDFKSVSTAAARYQNLAINQAKLSGQCGRLKCCLNFELDTYMDALKAFPKNTDKLKTQAGIANLVKTDIFKGIMYFAYHKDGRLGKFYPLEVEQVKKIKAMNAKGEFPLDLMSMQIVPEAAPVELDFESVNDVIELPPEERRRRGRGRGRGGSKGGRGNRSNRPDKKRSDSKRPDNKRSHDKKSDGKKPNNRRNDNRKNGPKTDDKKPNNRRGRGRKPANNEGDKPTTDNSNNKQRRGNKPTNKSGNQSENQSGNQQGNKSTAKPNSQGKGKPRPTNKPVNPQSNKPAPVKSNQANKPADKPTPPPVVNKTVEKPAAPKSTDKPVVDKAAGNAAKLAALNKKRNKSRNNKNNKRGGKPKGKDNNSDGK